MDIKYMWCEWEIGKKGFFETEDEYHSGYDRKMLEKRVRAFKNIFFPMYAHKIRNFEEVRDEEKINELLKDLAKKLRPLVSDIIMVKDTKSYLELRNVLIDFCKRVGINIDRVLDSKLKLDDGMKDEK